MLVRVVTVDATTLRFEPRWGQMYRLTRSVARWSRRLRGQLQRAGSRRRSQEERPTV